MTETLAALLAESRKMLADAGFDDAGTDARTLIAGLLDITATELVLRPDRPVESDQVAAVRAAIARRLAHEPVHRILGYREFYGLRLLLSADTLEPRPDTEVLVEAMLPHARRIVGQKGNARLLDLGTGTGAIALCLAKEVAELVAVGSDIAGGALETAERNADLNGVAERFSVVKSHWFDEIKGRFDIIVSNPPYIRSSVIDVLDPDVRKYDPIRALDGGSDGLDAYRHIAQEAHAFLDETGIVGLEIGFDQKQAVTDLFLLHGYTLIEAISDYGGNDRVLAFAREKP